MTKRVAENERGTSKMAKTSTHWTQVLYVAMKDPENIVQEDEMVVVIRDRYPKARHHYLVLPKQKISGIHDLGRAHLTLLEHMQSVARGLEGLGPEARLGFHSRPSLAPLHLHALSSDLCSSALKTKTHWNSFTTQFFIPSEVLIKIVTDKGTVEKISDVKHKELMNTPLKCHKCSAVFKNIPTLKTHVAMHQTS